MSHSILELLSDPACCKNKYAIQIVLHILMRGAMGNIYFANFFSNDDYSPKLITK